MVIHLNRRSMRTLAVACLRGCPVYDNSDGDDNNDDQSEQSDVFVKTDIQLKTLRTYKCD